MWQIGSYIYLFIYVLSFSGWGKVVWRTFSTKGTQIHAHPRWVLSFLITFYRWSSRTQDPLLLSRLPWGDKCILHRVYADFIQFDHIAVWGAPHSGKNIADWVEKAAEKFGFSFSDVLTIVHGNAVNVVAALRRLKEKHAIASPCWPYTSVSGQPHPEEGSPDEQDTWGCKGPCRAYQEEWAGQQQARKQTKAMRHSWA